MLKVFENVHCNEKGNKADSIVRDKWLGARFSPYEQFCHVMIDQ